MSTEFFLHKRISWHFSALNLRFNLGIYNWPSDGLMGTFVVVCELRNSLLSIIFIFRNVLHKFEIIHDIFWYKYIMPKDLSKIKKGALRWNTEKWKMNQTGYYIAYHNSRCDGQQLYERFKLVSMNAVKWPWPHLREIKSREELIQVLIIQWKTSC